MKALLKAYLAEHWNAEHAEQVQYSPVPKEKSGDLALSFFALTKELKQAPPVLAAQVAEVLQECDLIEKAEVAGPYLNVFFSTEAFFSSVLTTPLSTSQNDGEKIMVEFSGPNTNKPLHLGHMRNHALGISTANLFDATGAEVIRVNIVNDKGLALAKTMLAFDRFASDQTPESEGKKSDEFVGDLYVRYETEFKKDPSLEKELPEIMRKWEAQDPKWYGLWEKLTNWVLKGVEQTYIRQGIKFDKAYRESELYEEGVAIAKDGLARGVFFEKEDGAIAVDLEDEKLGIKVVLRADGTAIYLTNDLATARMRYDDYKPDTMIYVVADEQAYYFKTLFSSLERLGLLDRKHLYHLSYGLVNLPTGRMKSREGTVVDADNLMDELSDIAFAEIKKRNEELNDKEARVIAEQIMNAAWKFYILSTSPKKGITFDAQKSIDFQGATGPYIQYAGVRIKSLFEKAGLEMSGLENIDLSAFSEDEKSLGVKILEYPDMLDKAADNYNTTYVVTYLIELSQEWSRYYAHTSILNADTDAEKKSRLALAAKVYKNLEAGLKVLGIEIPEKM